MNLKILFAILVYFALLSLIFIFGGSALLEGYSSNTSFDNDTTLVSSEIDTGGLFGSGVSFTRFLGLIGLGIGLPQDTPNWFTIPFTIWQTIISIFSVGFIISSIWNG